MGQVKAISCEQQAESLMPILLSHIRHSFHQINRMISNPNENQYELSKINIFLDLARIADIESIYSVNMTI